MATSSASRNTRRLPKLMACKAKVSVDSHRQRLLYGFTFLDAKGLRRHKLPLHDCVLLEMREAGFTQSAHFLADLLYDNKQLLKEDHLGIMVDLCNHPQYLENLRKRLEQAEMAHDKEETNVEILVMLRAARHFAKLERGIMWLADKLFLTAIAVASRYQVDGGRQKLRCKYYFGKFLLDKFPGLDSSQAYDILTGVRDASNGKPWLLFDPKEDSLDGDEESQDEDVENMFVATNMLLYKMLCDRLQSVRLTDPLMAERIARLAVRRAHDGGNPELVATALIEIGLCQFAANNLNTALTSFTEALRIFEDKNNITGVCLAKMHLAAVAQRTGGFALAERQLTEMGATAMEHQLWQLLGRALHLLGELHLHCGRTSLATQHLTQAFLCFMGFRFKEAPIRTAVNGSESEQKSELDSISSESQQVFLEEAEQSRFTMAISAGEEVMHSFMELLHQAENCTVAKVKAMEWKLRNLSWGVERRYLKFIPCACPRHRRTALDALRLKTEAMLETLMMPNSHWPQPQRQPSVEDMTLLASARRLSRPQRAITPRADA